jgi:alkylation response protein AidB-like acyl-CoA dehydrogenase
MLQKEERPAINGPEPSGASCIQHVKREIGEAELAEITAELAKTAGLHDRAGSFPFENFALLRRHGVIGLQASRDLCNDPLDLVQARRVIAGVARGEPSTALVLVMTWLFSLEIARNPHWPDALRGHVLRDIAANGALANFLRVEPALGTPARGGLPETTARRVPGGWSVSGHKLYSTGIPALAWLGVWGRTDDAEPLVGNFLVPGNAPGVRIVETWDQLGMRASGSHDAILEDVFIPEDHAVDIRPPAAWQTSWGPEQLLWMSVLLASLYDAVARNARDWLLQFALARQPSNLGAALSTLPRYQERLGEIDALLFTNTVLLDRASIAASGELSANECNFVKRNVTNNAISVAQLALALIGNPGLSRANPLERHVRDTLSGRVHTPQEDVILIAAGKAAFASASQTGS